VEAQEQEPGHVTVIYVLDNYEKEIYVTQFYVQVSGVFGEVGLPVQNLVEGVLEADQEPVKGEPIVLADQHNKMKFVELSLVLRMSTVDSVLPQLKKCRLKASAGTRR